jgi:hypothetical protein
LIRGFVGVEIYFIISIGTGFNPFCKDIGLVICRGEKYFALRIEQEAVLKVKIKNN